MKQFLIAIAIFCSYTIVAQDTVKIMTYNLLDYNNPTSYCTTDNNNLSVKDGYLRTIFSYEMPDIFAAHEVSGYVDASCKHLLDSVINVNGVTWYHRANFINSNNSDIISTLFYDSRKFTLYNQNFLSGGVRDLMIFKLYYNSPDISTLYDTVFITCVAMHLKAGSTTSDQSERAAETLMLMNYINGVSGMGNCLTMGDFNVQSSNETCFQNLINYPDSNVRFYDPINKPGDWNNNSSFAAFHTQSTSTDDNNTCMASGGMDDRFDFILASYNIMNNISKVAYVPDSYLAVGQDGNHFNHSINNPTNNSVPSDVLDALAGMSDHLPVILKLKISQTHAIGISEHFSKPETIKFENPVNDEAHFQIYSTKNDTYILKMYNQLGCLITTYTYQVYPGYNRISVPMNNFVSGLYYFNFVNSEKNTTLKIMKK